MRFAVTGTHGSGKSALIDDFVSAHNQYRSVSEPYWQLLQQGVVFADGPTVADLEQQLRQSCSLMTGVEGDGLVFIVPLDLIAYLDVVSAAESEKGRVNPGPASLPPYSAGEGHSGLPRRAN